MLRTLQDFERCTIGATDGDIGRVKDLYFDDHDWVVRYLVVDAGSWLASRQVLISPISVQKPDWAAHQLPAGLTRGQVRDSPDIDTDQPVSRQHEVDYLGYYGYPGYWGGVGTWGGGMVPFAMAPGYAGPAAGAAARDIASEESLQAERARHRDADPRLRSGKAVVGYHLQASDGEVGHVEGLLIDDETWAIRYLVVNTSNWWLGHAVLIAPQWTSGVHWGDQTVVVGLSCAAVQTAPAYDPSAVLDRRAEHALFDHHQRRPYWRAGSTLEGDT